MTVRISRRCILTTPYEPCGMCHDTGIALFVEDGETRKIWGPVLNNMRADDLIDQLCADVLKPDGGKGITRREGAWRFHTVAADCTCKRRPRFTAGEESQIDKLRNLFKKPSGAQFQGMGWTSYEQLNDPTKTKGLRVAQYFANHDEYEDKHKRIKRGLVLSGACGVGKTGLMYCIYRAREMDGAVWCDFNEMIALIQSTYGSKSNDTLKIIQALEFVPVLLIDDMGDMARATGIPDDKRDKTYDILRVRHERKLLTIITTNLDYAGAKKQFGQRIYSRLREMAVWVTVGGRDLRIPMEENDA